MSELINMPYIYYKAIVSEQMENKNNITRM